MYKGMLVLLLVVSSAVAAEAQTNKRVSLGAGVSSNHYSDSRFSSKEFGLVPMYRLSTGGAKKDGWGWDLKGSVSFSSIKVPAEIAATEVQLGKVRTIPLMVGGGPSYRHGATKIGAWMTAGPSFNDFEIDDAALAAYQAAGNTLEAVHAKTSFAFRPGVSASYDLLSWLALQGSVSYMINRPTVHTLVNGVRTSKKMKLDHSKVAAGFVVGMF